jgi:hypothetical protein
MPDYTFHPRWVKPFYLELMGFNFLRLDSNQQAEFAASLREIFDELDDTTLREMNWSSWRPQKVAAWVIGIRRLKHVTELLGQELFRSPSYTEHLCFALARLGGPIATTALALYLEEYIKPADGSYLFMDRYSFQWTLAALIWIDEQEGTTTAQKYLEPGGLWEGFLAAMQNYWDHWDQRRPQSSQARSFDPMAVWNLQRTNKTFGAAMNFCHTYFDNVT